MKARYRSTKDKGGGVASSNPRRSQPDVGNQQDPSRLQLRFAVTVLLCAVILTSAVALYGSTGASPVAGTRWVLVESGPTAAPVAAPPDAQVFLEFSPMTDQVIGHVGCRCIGAAFNTAGADISFQLLWSTANFCGTLAAPPSAWFTDALLDVESYAVQGPELSLIYGQGQSRLLFTRDRSEELAGTAWILEEFGAVASPTAVLPDTVLTLAFDKDLAVASGGAGCNRFWTEVTAMGTSMTFGSFLMHAMGCSEPILTQEAAYLNALGSVAQFVLTADELVLSDGSDSVRLVYTRDLSSALAGTSWYLDEYGPVASPNDPAAIVGSVPRLQFAENLEEASGYDGLNLFTWEIAFVGNRIEILEWQSTMMGCIGDCAALEDMQDDLAVAHAEPFAVSAGQLVFSYNGGSDRLVYARDWSVELAGTDWLLASHGSIVDPSPPVEGWPVPALSFADDLASLAGTDGTNSYWADTSFLPGNRMDLTNWMTTLIGCIGDCDDLYAQWDAIDEGILGSFALDDGALTFTYRGGTHQLVYGKDTTSRLSGTRWVLEAYGSPSAAIGAAAPPQFYVEFSEPTDAGVGWTRFFVHGRAECSAVSAEMTLHGGGVTVGPIASSTTGAAGCPYTPLHAQEKAFRDGVLGAEAYTLNGDSLILTYDGGAAALRLRRDRSPDLAGTRWLLESYGCSCDPVRAFAPIDLMEEIKRVGIAFALEPQAAAGSLRYDIEARGCCLGLEGTSTMGYVSFALGSPALTFSLCDFTKYWPRDNAFLGALLMAESYQLLEDRLILRYHEGCDQLTLRPDPAGELAGTTWVLIGHGPLGVPTAAIPGMGGGFPELTFSEDLKSYSGWGGCNSFMDGALDAFDDTLAFGPALQTLMWCSPDTIMDQESTFLSLLRAASGFEFRDGKLAIQYTKDGMSGELLFDPAT